jgi:RimJ/RimL family protein N-acetyltransferase
MIAQVEVLTDRLRLRQWRESDRGPFHEAINGVDEVMRYFPAVLDRAQSDGTLDYFISGIEERGWGFWAVDIRESDEFIGFIGIQPVPERLPFAPAIEVGWRLRQSAWGCGFATEGALESLRFAFEELDADEVVSFTAVTNERSWRVMERLAMTRGPKTFEYPDLPQGHPLRTHVLYTAARPISAD